MDKIILIAAVIPNDFNDGYTIRLSEAAIYPKIDEMVEIDDIVYQVTRIQWVVVGDLPVVYVMFRRPNECMPFVTEEMKNAIANQILARQTYYEDLCATDRSDHGT